MALYGALRTQLYRLLQRADGRPMKKSELDMLLLPRIDLGGKQRLAKTIARGIAEGRIVAVYRGQYAWNGDADIDAVYRSPRLQEPTL